MGNKVSICNNVFGGRLILEANLNKLIINSAISNGVPKSMPFGRFFRENRVEKYQVATEGQLFKVDRFFIHPVSRYPANREIRELNQLFLGRT